MGLLNIHADATFSHERIVISGKNGSGKTSLIRLIAGLEDADQGHLSFFGETWFDSSKKFKIPAYQRKAACVFAKPCLLPWLSVADNIYLGLSPEQKVGARDAMQEVVRTLSLHDLMAKESIHLSAGEAQRVALARAIISLPKLLLLDEPFSAQSPKMRRYLQKWLIDFQTHLRFPLVMVTHDNDEALAIAERRWHMRNGKLICLEGNRKTGVTPVEWSK